VWELSSAGDEQAAQRAELLCLYVELRDALATTTHEFAACAGALVSEYQLLLLRHTRLLSQHRDWLLHNVERKKLPSGVLQATLVGAQADLMLVHETVRELLAGMCRRADEEAEAEAEAEAGKNTVGAWVSGGRRRSDSHPYSPGPLESSLPDALDLRDAFLLLLDEQYVLLAAFPALQSDMRGLVELGAGAASSGPASAPASAVTPGGGASHSTPAGTAPSVTGGVERRRPRRMFEMGDESTGEGKV